MPLRPDPDPLHTHRPDDGRHRGPASNRRVRVVIESGPDEPVVVKTGSNPAAIVAVEREALVLSQVRHPNVVDLVRTERSDDEATLVTQFAGALTLDEIRPVDAADVARIGAALLTVLGDLHTMGWAHGRVRAEHCIVGSDGRITLCAFGAAHRIVPRDPRRSTDLGDAVGVIALLTGRVAPPPDRAGRRRLRQLRTVLASTVTGPSGPAAAERLRADLSRLSGSVASASTVDPTTTQPSRRAVALAREAATTRPTATPRPSRVRGVLVAGAALVGLFATVGFLRWVGGPLGGRGASGVRGVGDLPEPLVLALTIIRVVAFAACLYGIVLTAATLAAILTRRPDIERLATGMAPPRLRKAIAGLIGLGMLSSVAIGPASGGVPRPDAPSQASPTTWPTTTAPATTAASTTPPPTTAPPQPVTPTDRHVDLVASADTAGHDPGHDAAESPPPVAPVPFGLPTMWVMAPGDHLWGVATAALEQHLGRPAHNDEIDGYWRRLVEMNRGSLLDPDNPDLIFAGQVIELPPFV